MFNTYICTNNNDNDRTFFLATQNTSTGDNDKAIEKGFQIVKECCKIIICFPCSLHFKKTILNNKMFRNKIHKKDITICPEILRIQCSDYRHLIYIHVY